MARTLSLDQAVAEVSEIRARVRARAKVRAQLRAQLRGRARARPTPYPAPNLAPNQVAEASRVHGRAEAAGVGRATLPVGGGKAPVAGGGKLPAGGGAGRLCFEFATIGLEGRGGHWDAMMYDHPGRWGPRDVYRGVWAANRRRIRALYGLRPAPPPPRFAAPPPASDSAGALSVGVHVNANANAGALLRAPAGVWVLRGGKARSDVASADAIIAAFREQGGMAMAPFNLAQRLPPPGAAHGERHGAGVVAGARHAVPGDPLVTAAAASLDSATAPLGNRGARARDLLALLASTDVLVGMFGAGLWNGLFLRPGSLLLELKTTYGYSGNENGRGIANANGLAYYMADVRRFQPAMKGGGGQHRYPRWWLRRLVVM